MADTLPGTLEEQEIINGDCVISPSMAEGGVEAVGFRTGAEDRGVEGVGRTEAEDGGVDRGCGEDGVSRDRGMWPPSEGDEAAQGDRGCTDGVSPVRQGDGQDGGFAHSQ